MPGNMVNAPGMAARDDVMLFCILPQIRSAQLMVIYHLEYQRAAFSPRDSAGLSVHLKRPGALRCFVLTKGHLSNPRIPLQPSEITARQFKLHPHTPTAANFPSGDAPLRLRWANGTTQPRRAASPHGVSNWRLSDLISNRRNPNFLFLNAALLNLSFLPSIPQSTSSNLFQQNH